MSDVRLDRVIDMFKILAENEYSILWDLVEDFEVNGHKVSVQRSTQLNQVIIDNTYVSIGGKMQYMIPDENEDGKYVPMTALEYVRHRLSKEI